MNSLAVSAVDIDRTATDTAIAQWGVAAVVMVGSMAAGGYTFHYLHEPAFLGVITAFAVDLALAMWLRIASRLRALGISSKLGWALEITTMGQTLYLNIGAAVFRGGVGVTVERWALGFAHSFLPTVLVLVTLAGGEAQLRLLKLRREQEEVEQAAVEDTERRMRAERQVDAERSERIQQSAVRQAELELLNHREERAMRDRQAIANLTSILTLGATWRRRPKARPKAPSQTKRAVPDPVPAVVPPVRPTSVPVTDDLLSQARRLRAQRLSQDETTGRAVLQRELKIPERTARELAKLLDADRAPLHAVSR